MELKDMLDGLNDKNAKMATECLGCRDKGEIYGCPICGKTKEIVIDIEEEEFKAEVSDSAGNVKQVIPSAYLQSSWDPNTLMQTHPHLCERSLGTGKSDNLNFINYVSKLKQLRDIFMNRRLPAKSIFIEAPPGFSKICFAYDCLKIARSYGFTIAPILDTAEVKQFFSMSVERPYYKYMGQLTFEKYILSDVLIMTVVKTHHREWAYEIIQQIIDSRSRKGLATIIISRYNLKEIAHRDASNEFEPSVMATSVSKFKKMGTIKFEEN